MVDKLCQVHLWCLFVLGIIFPNRSSRCRQFPLFSLLSLCVLAALLAQLQVLFTHPLIASEVMTFYFAKAALLRLFPHLWLAPGKEKSLAAPDVAAHLGGTMAGCLVGTVYFGLAHFTLGSAVCLLFILLSEYLFPKLAAARNGTGA